MALVYICTVIHRRIFDVQVATALLKDHAAEDSVGEHSALLDKAARSIRNGVTGEDPCSDLEVCKSTHSERNSSMQGYELSTQAAITLKDASEEEHHGSSDSEEPAVEQTSWWKDR